MSDESRSAVVPYGTYLC